MKRKFKNAVPVIDETGQVVGEAIPDKIVGGHTNENYYPYIKFQGKNVARSFDEDQPDRILILPSKNIW